MEDSDSADDDDGDQDEFEVQSLTAVAQRGRRGTTGVAFAKQAEATSGDQKAIRRTVGNGRKESVKFTGGTSEKVRRSSKANALARKGSTITERRASKKLLARVSAVDRFSKAAKITTLKENGEQASNKDRKSVLLFTDEKDMETVVEKVQKASIMRSLFSHLRQKLAEARNQGQAKITFKFVAELVRQEFKRLNFGRLFINSIDKDVQDSKKKLEDDQQSHRLQQIICSQIGTSLDEDSSTDLLGDLSSILEPLRATMSEWSAQRGDFLIDEASTKSERIMALISDISAAVSICDMHRNMIEVNVQEMETIKKALHEVPAHEKGSYVKQFRAAVESGQSLVHELTSKMAGLKESLQLLVDCNEEQKEDAQEESANPLLAIVKMNNPADSLGMSHNSGRLRAQVRKAIMVSRLSKWTPESEIQGKISSAIQDIPADVLGESWLEKQGLPKGGKEQLKVRAASKSNNTLLQDAALEVVPQSSSQQPHLADFLKSSVNKFVGKLHSGSTTHSHATPSDGTVKSPLSDLCVGGTSPKRHSGIFNMSRRTSGMSRRSSTESTTQDDLLVCTAVKDTPKHRLSATKDSQGATLADVSDKEVSGLRTQFDLRKMMELVKPINASGLVHEEDHDDLKSDGISSDEEDAICKLAQAAAIEKMGQGNSIGTSNLIHSPKEAPVTSKGIVFDFPGMVQRAGWIKIEQKEADDFRNREHRNEEEVEDSDAESEVWLPEIATTAHLPVPAFDRRGTLPRHPNIDRRKVLHLPKCVRPTTATTEPRLLTADRPYRGKARAIRDQVKMLPRHPAKPKRLDVISDNEPFTLRLAKLHGETRHNASGGYRKTAKIGVSYAAGSKGNVEISMWSWNHSELVSLQKTKMVSSIPPVPCLFAR